MLLIRETGPIFRRDCRPPPRRVDVRLRSRIPSRGHQAYRPLPIAGARACGFDLRQARTSISPRSFCSVHFGTERKTKSPRLAGRGLELFRMGRLLPFLAAVPVIHFLRSLILGIAVTLLQAAGELLALTLDDIEVVARELAPFLLNLAFEFRQVYFQTIQIKS